ncbi:MAG: bifunctional phosphoribosylaminoimidazolecarboxamide formyltransferase/IMP cyclohydrolase [Clostridiales bacterium]|nr:bifunctional phosphoribosylaminoimidazolecarboxamide formyltransferase/IMP cyclohydrolase [Clostridiales bacterium]
MKKRAFLSVSDKSGIVEFAKDLVELGYEVISTGGTERTIREAGVAVTNVSDITGFPECLDGRVKTLHPAVHAGILYMRENPDHVKQMEELGIAPIDIVAVNLYPFKATIMKPGVAFEDAIENIDIGGPTMLRAAAKNHRDVAVIVDAADYKRVVDCVKAEGEVPYEVKLDLCKKVFEHTAAYDALIASYLRGVTNSDLPDNLTLTYEKAQDMRYGENPHQKAVFYRELLTPKNSLAMAEQLNGKELSFNNINDTNGALDLLREFRKEEKAVVIGVKHANPCGVGIRDTIADAYRTAYEADPVSIFGGIVACNRKIDAETAAEMNKIFLEIIVAPDYDDDALAILCKKKNLRVLKLPAICDELPKEAWDMKKVLGGLLVQDLDREVYPELTCVTKRQPTEQELLDLELAWKIVKHTKSNGIAIAKDGQSLGIGPGQVNRIWAAEMAMERSGEKVKGAALASDAFFPFDDCVKAAAAAGITAIIQPGGSIKDADSIAACDEAGIAMVFTGMRHFKH